MRVSIWALLVLTAGIASAETAKPAVVEVDCDSRSDLQEAIDKVAREGGGEIRLRGVCKGSYEIRSDGITLRGIGPSPGILATDDDALALDIIDSSATLRGLTIQGGDTGVRIREPDANVLMANVELFGQGGQALFLEGRARVRLFECFLHDTSTGIFAVEGSEVEFLRSIASGLRRGISIFDQGRLVVSESTFEDNEIRGILLRRASIAVVLSATFSNNGEVHIQASGQSQVEFPTPSRIGSDQDETAFSLQLFDGSHTSLFFSEPIYGDLLVTSNSSLQMAFADLHGNLQVERFGNAWLANAEVVGTVECSDGGDAICRGVPTQGSAGCPSSTCASPTFEPLQPNPKPPQFDLERLRESYLSEGGSANR